MTPPDRAHTVGCDTVTDRLAFLRNATPTLFKARRPIDYLLPMALLGFVGIWTLTFSIYSAGLSRQEKELSTQALSLATTIEQQTRATINDLDYLIMTIRSAHSSASISFDQAIAASSWVYRRNAFAMITDRDGNIVTHSIPNASKSTVNIADRQAFQFQKNASDDTLFIHAPCFGRRIEAPH